MIIIARSPISRRWLALQGVSRKASNATGQISPFYVHLKMKNTSQFQRQQVQVDTADCNKPRIHL